MNAGDIMFEDPRRAAMNSDFKNYIQDVDATMKSKKSRYIMHKALKHSVGGI